MKEIFKYFKMYYPNLKKINSKGVYQKLGSFLVGIEFEKSIHSHKYYPAAARILSCGVVNNNKGMHAKLLKT